MRLAAQAKLGFYPAHPLAIAECLKHLKMPDDGRVRILDPCCGKGEALEQIRASLNVPAGDTYAVEMDMGRAAEAEKLLGPDAHVLGPCSYLIAQISAGAFSLAWVNPPFDHELGGGKRQEHTFVEHATRHLKTGGVLALVMPFGAIEKNDKFRDLLDDWYDDGGFYQFPSIKDEKGEELTRRYKEVIYFGHKRRERRPTEQNEGRLLRGLQFWRASRVLDPVVGTDERVWEIPPVSGGVKSFAKKKLTEQEQWAMLQRSPLMRFLAPAKPLRRMAPPMPLCEGHVALVLASGLLNGLIRTVDGYQFVVRGVSKKVKTKTAQTAPEYNPKTKVTSFKETWLELPKMEIRAIDGTGEIVDFGDKTIKESDKTAKKGVA